MIHFPASSYVEEATDDEMPVLRPTDDAMRPTDDAMRPTKAEPDDAKPVVVAAKTTDVYVQSLVIATTMKFNYDDGDKRCDVNEDGHGMVSDIIHLCL